MLKYTIAVFSTLLLSFSLLSSSPVRAQSSVTLTVSGTFSGTTPRVVGYNFHALPRPDQATWMRHSEMSGARNWLDEDLLFEDQGPPAPVASATQFIRRRMHMRTEINDSILGNGPSAQCGAQLSASTPSAFVDWNKVFATWAGSGNAETIDEEVRDGDDPLFSITLSKSRAPLRTDTAEPLYWQDRWILWRNVFTHAYYAATRWQAATWLFYNEPNSATGLTKLEFVERLRLASDAVQLAIKTINKRRTYCGDPLLTAKIVAPATLGNNTLYTNSASQAWLSGPSPEGNKGYFCDPAIVDDTSGSCYGRSVIQHRVTDNFYGWSLAAADSFSTLFHTYAFQKYEGIDAARYQMEDVWTYLDNYPGGAPLMEVALTETNIDRTGTWPSGTTADTPSQFSRFGQMLIHDAYADPGISGVEPDKSLYIAKFHQDAADPKGCFHMGRRNQVGGATMLAEVARLFAKGFSGAHPRYTVSSSNAGVNAVASYDAAKSVYYVMIANGSTTDFNASLNANALSFGPTAVMAETVSAERRGNASVMNVSSKTFPVSVAAQSVTLMTIPTPSVIRFTTLTPAADATVKGGVNRFTNYGTSSNLWAAGSTNSAGARNVSFLRFQIPSWIDRDDILFAVLDVYGQAKTTDGTIGMNAIAHVYGIEDDSWTETGVKGYNAPNLAYEDTPTTRIEDNFVTDVGLSAEFVGHLTGLAQAGHFGTDVTRWLKTQIDNSASFMLTREIRFNPGDATLNAEDTLTDATRSVWMAAREDADSLRRPRLMIYTR
ncbi:CBM96 family carbohydrate-binding protein [Nocardia barduliensis]|uniref:CBM96 family carbohydrate-binding protein n=1 Tax=Nocardia barduliensis TaxID=2736643 RepID=UPI0015744ED2|nr:DNRLRE domain-containing protein [Nocardia barduliensis]